MNGLGSGKRLSVNGQRQTEIQNPLYPSQRSKGGSFIIRANPSHPCYPCFMKLANGQRQTKI